jgi:ketosteroid isomerase-like protein
VVVETGNIGTVQRIYEAFGRGDVAEVLEQLAEDVAWEHWETGNSGQDAGLPWLTRRTGRGDVAAFFETLAGELDLNSFQPLELLEGDRSVAAVIRIEATVRATGRRIEDEEIHLWTFGDSGKVIAHRHFLDTGKHVAAFTA